MVVAYLGYAVTVAFIIDEGLVNDKLAQSVASLQNYSARAAFYKKKSDCLVTAFDKQEPPVRIGNAAPKSVIGFASHLRGKIFNRLEAHHAPLLLTATRIHLPVTG